MYIIFPAVAVKQLTRKNGDDLVKNALVGRYTTNCVAIVLIYFNSGSN